MNEIVKIDFNGFSFHPHPFFLVNSSFLNGQNKLLIFPFLKFCCSYSRLKYILYNSIEPFSYLGKWCMPVPMEYYNKVSYYNKCVEFVLLILPNTSVSIRNLGFMANLVSGIT